MHTEALERSSGARPKDWAPRRLVVVSNRLPVVVEGSGAALTVRRTVGGLAAGVSAFLRSPSGSALGAPPLWVGWAGNASTKRDVARLREAVEAQGGLRVVSLPTPVQAKFYDGFCNRTLWPLCHTLPGQVHLDVEAWEAYRAANEAFVATLLEVLEPDDAVWVHDFHLMLLPELLRRQRPDVAVAYFHHIPFPALDVLRVLPDPWARRLLEGLLGADVIGLHTYDDVRKLIRACEHLLGTEFQGHRATHAGRATLVDAYPIGVDFARWDSAADRPAVQEHLAALEAPLAGRRVILSVDRLDYTKGILNRLLAFERLLATDPALRRRVVLLAVVVPSRTNVEAYRTMRAQIDEAVGRINGQHGEPDWAPVLYRYRALDEDALAAHYLRADVAMVTPLRDGMNLVAKEYLAARRDESGVLVLSDTAGAARELGEAVLVNPFHVEGLAEALKRALDLAPEALGRGNRHMRARLRRYDVTRWGEQQVEALVAARRLTRALEARRLPPDQRRRLLDAWTRADARLLLLDYDGTLVPFTQTPSAAVPDPALHSLLTRLARRPSTRIVLLSGRDAATLERWFEGVPIDVVAEHGARRRASDGVWVESPGLRPDVRARVLDVMQVFADRLPGAYIEPKERSLAWHWRASDPDVGAQRARELTEALGSVGLGADGQVLLGKKVVEARALQATKGAAARHWLAAGTWSFLLAAGDDATDEDLFAVLPESAWSLRVGPEASRARFNVDDLGSLRALLEELASA